MSAPPKKARQGKDVSISRPQDPLLHIPRPELGYDNKPIRIKDYELDKSTIEAALTKMANYIDSQRQYITVITVGGAVNTLLLQNRPSTHDVDFLGTNLNNDQRVLLGEAAKYAERRSQKPLGGEWVNNQTMLWLPPDVHRTVTEQALQQNEVVFRRKGLKIVAAPWNYAFCGKMNRLVRADQARAYDLTDAVSYLHRYIQIHGGPISVALIKEWCKSYQKDTSDDVIRNIKKEYRRQYGADGISN